MARAVTPPRRLALAGLIGVALASAQAAGPNDPFSPPARAAFGAVSGPGLVAEPQAPGVLAGVRLGREPSALIDGQWHAPGHTVRGARLVAIHADGARLQHADGRVEHLPLYAPPPPAPAATSGEVTFRSVPRRGSP